MNVTTCNPLLRTPLALIVDDSCPVINLTYDWIAQRHAWKARHQPGVRPERYEGDPDQVPSLPRTIPADFAARWGEWCGEQGIKGKFSLVPFPAGVGRVDQGFPDHPAREFERWLAVYRDTLSPNFDLTPEMLTHTHVVDLKTWQLRDEWEQFEWADPPLEPLTDYIAAALTLLRDAGFPCAGVTSPGGFGGRQEEGYARATLDASLRVNGEARPFYFLRVASRPGEWPDVPVRHADPGAGVAIASIVGCTDDWFGGWTGYDAGNPDLFITPDLQGGRLPSVLARELPCVLVGHWPGFYFGGAEVGFRVLQEVKHRLDAYDPDGTKTRWMKTSEIGRYWMARQLGEISVTPAATGETRVSVRTRFPTPDFTVSLDTAARRVRLGGQDLRPAASRRDFQSGTFLVEGERTYVAFDLASGDTDITVWP